MNNLKFCLVITLTVLISLPIQLTANRNDFFSEITEIETYSSSNELECSVAEHEILIIKNVISNLLSTEISKNSFQLEHNNFSVELTIDEQGIVTDFRIIDGKANQDLIKHIDFIVTGWQIEDLNPTDKLKLIIPLIIF